MPEIYLGELSLDLKKIFSSHEVSIILVLREQTDLLGSLYRGYIKAGSSKRCNEFLEEVKKEYLLFSKYLDKVVEVFNENKLFIGYFEDFKNNKFNFLKNLIEFMGEKEMPDFEDEYVNRGYGALQLKIARLINSIFKTKVELGGYISVDNFNYYLPINFPKEPLLYSQKLHYKKFELSKEEKERLKEYFVDDNKRFKRNYNLNLPNSYLPK